MVRESFESEWSQLARRLRARLERKRVPAWLVDDVIQETGLRLFQMWPEVDAARSPWGLTITIANHLIWDETNRRRAREVPTEVPERAANHDVEEASLARLELARVDRYMRQMSAAHRSILLAEVGEASIDTSSSGDALKMRRMRARRRLTSLLEGASASVVFAGQSLRDSVRRASDLLRRWNDSSPAQAASAAASLFAAAVMLGAPANVLGSVESAEAAPVRTAEIGLKPFSFVPARHDMGTGTGSAHSAQVGRDRRHSDTSGEPSQGTAANFAIGDDGTPARGTAGVELVPDDDWQPSVPDCSVEPRPNGASANCRADTPVGEMNASGSVEVDP